MAGNPGPNEFDNLLDDASDAIADSPPSVDTELPDNIINVTPPPEPRPGPEPGPVPEPPPAPEPARALESEPVDNSEIFESIGRVNQVAKQRLDELEVAIPYKEQIEKGITTAEIYDPKTGKSKVDPDKMRQDARTLKEEKDRNLQLRENLDKLDHYLQGDNAVQIESERDRMRRAIEDAQQVAEKLGAIGAKSKKTEADLEAKKEALANYEKLHVPEELRGRFLVPDPKTEVETAYAAEAEKWIDAAQAAQQKASGAIAEGRLTPVEKTARDKEKEYQKYIRELEERVKQADLARDEAVKDVQRIRNSVAEGGIPPAAQEQIDSLKTQLAAEKFRADSAETKLKALENPEISEEEAEEEPELEGDLDTSPVETDPKKLARDRIMSSVGSALKNWAENLIPRNKDRGWWAGLAVGVAEGAAVNLAPLPGGRLLINGVNLIAAQELYAGIKIAERREINRLVSEGPVENDRVQAILDAREKYAQADHRVRNFFLGLSAGMTWTSIAGLLWGAAENLSSSWNHSLGSDAASSVPKAAKVVVATKVGTEAASPGGYLFDTTVDVKPESNFWKSLGLHRGFVDWQQSSGVHHSDTIKKMISEFARMNGHDLGHIQPGKINLLTDLKPDQLAIVQKAAAAKDSADYFRNVRPLYLAAIGKK